MSTQPSWSGILLQAPTCQDDLTDQDMEEIVLNSYRTIYGEEYLNFTEEDLRRQAKFDEEWNQVYEKARKREVAKEKRKGNDKEKITKKSPPIEDKFQEYCDASEVFLQKMKEDIKSVRKAKKNHGMNRIVHHPTFGPRFKKIAREFDQYSKELSSLTHF